MVVVYPSGLVFIVLSFVVFMSATDQHQRIKIDEWIRGYDKEIELVSTPLVAIFTAAMVFATITFALLLPVSDVLRKSWSGLMSQEAAISLASPDRSAPQQGNRERTASDEYGVFGVV